MYTLSQEFLGIKVPSSSYPMFLFEQFIWFKLRTVKEGRPYEIATSAKFLETFMGSNFEDQNLLCELYLHEMACPLDRHSNPVPFLGDVQLSDFDSFVSKTFSGKGLSKLSLTMRPNQIFGSKANLRILIFSLIDTRVYSCVPSKLSI